MNRSFLFLFFCGFLVFSRTASAALDLTPLIGVWYGVQVKEGRTSDEELKQIKAAGLDSVRFVIPWYEVEKGKGRFVWGYFDSFVQRLREHGLKAVIVLGAGHPLYTKRIEAPEGNIDHAPYYLSAPAEEEERKAFTRYAAETVKHFGTKDIIWEIWNEPDSDRFWAPKANAEDYIALAQATCQAIRAETPQAIVVGPGMADTPGRFGHLIPGFLGKLLLSPASSCLNAVSLHPYRDGARPPETVLSAYESLRSYIEAFTPQKQKPLPFLSTEWGFTLTQVSAEEQAAYLLRSFLLNTLSGVPVSIWYEWRDEREGEDDPEAHYGLLDLKKKEKESYKALKAFLPPLQGAFIEKRLPLGNEEDFVLQIRYPDQKQGIIFWTSREKAKTRLVIDDDEKDLTPLPQSMKFEKEAPSFFLEVLP